MYSIPMAIVDFIPVVFFASAAILLQRCLYNKMSKGAFALFAAGTIDVIMAGGLKALYKLLYAMGVCDFEKLSQMFFPVQAIGFMLAGIGLVAMMCHKQGDGKMFAAGVPAVFSGTFVFVALMILGLGGMDTVLCILAKKVKKPAIMVLFIISFIFCLMMGYLSSKDFSQDYMNWAAEAVNIIGQGALFAGAAMLRKHGLEDLELEKR